MATKPTQLVLGSGEIYFEPFAAGTMTGEGEVYIGNSPDFSFVVDKTMQEVKDSYRGQLITLEGETLQEIYTVRFSTDDVDLDNVAWWFGAVPARGTENPLTDHTETIRVKSGRYFQLGVSADHPVGLRGITLTAASVSGTPVSILGNFEMDVATGRLHVVRIPASVNDGDNVLLTYNTVLTKFALIKPVSRELFGALRFIATNTIGPRKNWYLPCVRLKANGEVALKSDVWQSWSFEGEARRKTPTAEYFYIDENIADLLGGETIPGFDYSTFPFYEDLLNTLINVTMASRGYIDV